MMKDKIANLSQMIAGRKKDMLEQFTNDIHGQNGIIFVSQQTLQKIAQSLKSLASILDSQIHVESNLKDKRSDGTSIFSQVSYQKLSGCIQ